MKMVPSHPVGGGNRRTPNGDGSESSVENRAVSGAAVGVVAGFVTIPAMILFLFVYSAVSTRQLGSTTVLALFMPGVLSIIGGGIVGSIAGRLCRARRVRVDGVRRGACFGGCFMAVVGSLITLADIGVNPGFFWEWAAFSLGLDLVSPIVAGVAVGAVFGAASRGRPALRLNRVH